MLRASIIIATRNRPDPLRRTLETVATQSTAPLELIVVDASEDAATEGVVADFAGRAVCAVRYFRSDVASAARQRNQGAEVSVAELVVFIDDDVELEPEFLGALMEPFETDGRGIVGGVTGTIVNTVYVPPRGLNRWLLQVVTGEWSGDWAGRVVGPAVAFLPADVPNTVQRVQWMGSGGTAYRRAVFMKYKFGLEFMGYSYGEDLHLSSRVGQDYQLLNSTMARYYHLDLGRHTHRNWREVGKSAVINRYAIMTTVMGRRSWCDRLRFLAYELVYGGVVAVKSSGWQWRRLRDMGAMMAGKGVGFVILLRGHGLGWR